jgi:hypothetical protein
MHYWTGLYLENVRKMMIEGMDMMLGITTKLL